MLKQEIIWTDYFIYKTKLRGFNLGNIESALKYSNERYHDTVTNRWVVIGKDASTLVMVPYEANAEGSSITPITVHATSRQQINYRVKTGRLQK